MEDVARERRKATMQLLIKKSLFVLSTLVFAAACDTSSGDNGATRVRQTVDGAGISLVQAIDAAVAAAPGGVVVEAELEVEAKVTTYEVHVFADAKLTKIHIDPANGAVIRSQVDPDADDIAEAAADAKLLQNSAIDAGAAIALAEQQRPGSTAFEFEVKDGALEVEVVDADGMFEIRVNPADGSVVEVDPTDDDHDDGKDDDDHDDDSDDDDGLDDDSDDDDTDDDGTDDDGDDTDDTNDDGDTDDTDDDGNKG